MEASEDKNRRSDDVNEVTPLQRDQANSLLSVEREKSKIFSDSSSSSDILESKVTPPSRSKRKEIKAGEGNELRSSGAIQVTRSGNRTVKNNYDAKKTEAVNIPAIRTFESVQIPS